MLASHQNVSKSGFLCASGTSLDDANSVEVYLLIRGNHRLGNARLSSSGEIQGLSRAWRETPHGGGYLEFALSAVQLQFRDPQFELMNGKLPRRTPFNSYRFRRTAHFAPPGPCSSGILGRGLTPMLPEPSFPVNPADFIGRACEIESFKPALHQSLITKRMPSFAVLGNWGIGKSRLLFKLAACCCALEPAMLPVRLSISQDIGDYVRFAESLG